MSDATLERIAGVVGGGGDADDVLRAVVVELAGDTRVAWAGIFFLEGDELVLGPEAGSEDVGRRCTEAIVYRNATIGELAVDGVADAPFLQRVAAAIAEHVLLGWDTGGETWEP